MWFILFFFCEKWIVKSNLRIQVEIVWKNGQKNPSHPKDWAWNSYKKGPVFITSFTKASYEIENFTLTAFHFELNRAKNFNERENFKMPCKSN